MVGVMKIVLINNLYEPYARGGAEQVVKTIADGLVEAGHKGVVVSTRPVVKSIKLTPSHDSGSKVHKVESQELATTSNDSNITSYSLLVTRYFFSPWNIISYYNLHKLPAALRLVWHLIDMFNPQSYFKIKKILKREQPDLVMTHNLTGVGFLTPLAIKHCGIRHIHTLHDIQLLHPSGLMLVGKEKKVDGLLVRVYQWCNKKLFRSVDMVISPSQWLLDEHAQRGFFRKAKKMVMANPMSVKNSVGAYPSLSEEEEGGGGEQINHACLRSSLVKRGIGLTNFIFLYVGQLAKHKGVELLVEAFMELNNDKCELWIAGDGDYKILNIKYQTSNKIKLLGGKSHDEIKIIMSKAHCLVVPSLCYENQPTVIREAKQNNLPVIASNIGGIPEILNHEFLFKAGDKESLKNKMQWFMDNYDEVQKTQKVETYIFTSAQDYVDKILQS